jgi:pyruvate formate-lyase/glycerol dehydratase family glycyl radical enzyme
MRLILTHGRIAIDPQDWFVDKVDHGCIVPGVRHENHTDMGGYVRKMAMGWLDEAVHGSIAETASWLEQAYKVGQATGPDGGLDRGHISPGWDIVFSQGLTGLLDKIALARRAAGPSATQEQLDFWEAVEIVYSSAIELANRFSRLAAKMADEMPEYRERLQIIASAMSNVPAHRPRTFHEALQLHWFLHEMIEMEGEWVRSAGQFDRTFYPFYQADLEAGRLNRDQAKELIQFFWYKWYARTQGRENGKNFCFGGVYADGTEITNDLTFVAFDAYEEMNTPDPKLSVRLSPSSPEELYVRIADLIRNGRNSFVLMNDPMAIEALVKRGIPVEDARLYLPIGCYEPAVEGKMVGCTMNITVNLAKGVELALNDGLDPATGQQAGPHTGDPRHFAGFEDMWNAYQTQMDYFLEHARDCIEAAEHAWPEINPSPMVAGAIEDCIALGKDVGQGGAHYNGVGFVGTGLANAADSLLAVKKTVFEDCQFTMDELLKALRNNFEGKERMRQYLVNRVAKWGNNETEVDAMAVRIADYYSGKVHTFTNGRGGPCMAALFSLTFALQGGLRTGALPDGRKARESLAPGLASTYGRDRRSVTALIDSICKLDATDTPNGAVLDVNLHPSALKGDDGLEALVALIKTFINQGGYAIQFNVFDTETLRKAQRHPERYANLQVRVTGWSVYFNALTPLEQEQYIARITHGN